MGGLRLSDHCGINISRGSPLFDESKQCYGPISVSTRTPVASLPPPHVSVGVRGEVRPLRTLRPKHLQGFSPCGQISKSFFLARFRLHIPAWLRPTSGGMHPWVRVVWWIWGGRTPSRTTNLSSCNSRGVPARLPKAAWQGDVIYRLQAGPTIGVSR